MFISDGTGKGFKAKVTREHMIYALATSQTIEHHTNMSHSDSYTVLFSQTAVGAGDYIFYMKNNSSNPVVVEGLWLRAASSEGINIHIRVGGTPSNGSDITPVNLNASAANTAEIDAQAGNNITGLTSGDICLRYYLDNSTKSNWFNFNQDIILTQTDIMTISCITGGIQIDGTIEFFFDHTNGAELA